MQKSPLYGPVFGLAVAVAACGNAVDGQGTELQAGLASSGASETAPDDTAAFGDDANAHHVQIAITWGCLTPHPNATEWVDWSGSFSVSNAALRVVETLRFENDGVVLRPRTDIHMVEFESQTRPYADGLLLDVILHPQLNPNRLPVNLRFDSAPFTDTLSILPGMELYWVKPIDDAGHTVTYKVVHPS